MITGKQIKQFTAKHHLDYIGPTGDGVQSFSGGCFFSDEDIVLDMEDNVPVGLIMLYMKEATDGHVRSYREWLSEHKYS